MNARPKRIEGTAVRVPAHLQPYVDALGIDEAVEFLLQFGGGYSYFSQKPDPESPIASVVGVEKATALAKTTGGGSMRIPTGKPFIARVLRARGMGTSAIARCLHVSDVTVRGWTQDQDARQFSLFDLPSAD